MRKTTFLCKVQRRDWLKIVVFQLIQLVALDFVADSIHKHFPLTDNWWILVGTVSLMQTYECMRACVCVNVMFEYLYTEHMCQVEIYIYVYCLYIEIHRLRIYNIEIYVCQSISTQ